jgi:hypothetical protein
LLEEGFKFSYRFSVVPCESSGNISECPGELSTIEKNTISFPGTTLFAIQGRFCHARRRRAVFQTKKGEKKPESKSEIKSFWGDKNSEIDFTKNIFVHAYFSLLFNSF